MNITERFWDYTDRHDVRRNIFATAGLGMMAVGGYVAEHQPFVGGPADVALGLLITLEGALGLVGAGMQQMEVLAEKQQQDKKARLAIIEAKRIDSQEQPHQTDS